MTTSHPASRGNPFGRLVRRALAVAVVLGGSSMAPDEAAAQVGQGCALWSPCPSGYSCHPFVQRCYNSPRREGQPCMAGYSCGAGLTCEAGTHVCRGPGGPGDACHLTRPCGAGLTCEAGSQRCRAPGAEGESCHLTRPCGSGLTCEAGTHICRRPGRAGESCHLTRPCGTGLTCEAGTHVCRTPGQINEPCHATRPCAAGNYCQPLIHKCAPNELDLTSAQLCSALRVEELSSAARGANLTMSYGAGGQASAGMSLAVESGAVYGSRGEFGCYATVCGGVQLDASINAYMALGIYQNYGDFPGASFVTSQGVSTPWLRIGPGFTTAQVMSTGGSLVGTSNAVSFGIGVSPLPFQVGAMTCCTSVIDGTTGRLRDLATGVDACRRQLGALVGAGGAGGAGGAVRPPPPPPPPPVTASRVVNRYRPDQVLFMEPVPGTEFTYLRASDGGHLHTERGALEVGAIDRGWWSAMWHPEPDAEGYVRLRNRHTHTYLHTENGPTEAGSIQPGWWSAQWSVAGQSLRPASPPQPLRAVARGPLCGPEEARRLAAGRRCADGVCPTDPGEAPSALRRLMGWLAGGPSATEAG
jgi:hypothetical protein